jgi:GTP-binding protein
MAALIFDYLRGRPNLRRVILLIDARRGVMDRPRAMGLLDEAAVSYLVVLDQDRQAVAGRARAKARTRLQGGLAEQIAAYPDVLATSSVHRRRARFAARPHRRAGRAVGFAL